MPSVSHTSTFCDSCQSEYLVVHSGPGNAVVRRCSCPLNISEQERIALERFERALESDEALDGSTETI